MSGHISFKVKGFGRDTVEVNLTVDSAEQAVEAHKNWTEAFDLAIGNGLKPKAAAAKKEEKPKAEQPLAAPVKALPAEDLGAIIPESIPAPPVAESAPTTVEPTPEPVEVKPAPAGKASFLPSKVFAFVKEACDDLIFLVPDFKNKAVNEVVQLLVPHDIDSQFTEAQAAEALRKALDAINVYCAAHELPRRYMETIRKIRECNTQGELDAARAFIVAQGHNKALATDERLFKAFKAIGKQKADELEAKAPAPRPALSPNDLLIPKPPAKTSAKPKADPTAALAAMDLIDVA